MPRIRLLLFACALGCGPSPLAPPPTDSCTTPSSGAVDTVELGAANSDDLAGRPTTFAPLQDGDGVTLIRGGQGATMLGFILRITGASAPTCLAQQTTITDATGARVTANATPLTTYAQPDATRLTHPLWLPADYPTTFVATVATVRQPVTLHLHLLIK